ncbi:MAG: hybrid sensor histidine kinase/response regulator transcription factor [Bacteroidota bacterium]
MKSVLLGFFLLLSGLSLSANEKYLIGFSQCTMVDIWREAMVREMEIELGIRPDLEMVMRDAADNSEKQIQDIRELMAMDIDLLIVSPNESEPLTPIVKEVYQSGIPVIVIDRKINSDDYDVYIGADNYQVGLGAGRYAVSLLKGKGRILEIWGLQGSSPAIERHAGFSDALKNAPGIEIAYSANGKWLWQEGKKAMQEHLAQEADFDLVFAQNDFMAHGAYLAAEAAGKADDYYIIGIDGLLGPKGGIQRVLEGKQDATVLYPTGGYEAIQTASKILNNQPYEKEVELNTVLIDSTNARIFKMQNQSIMGLQSKIQKHRSILDDQIQKYNSQQTLFMISLVLLALVIVLIILLFRSYRIKMQVNRDLKKQKEEIEKQNREIKHQQQQLIKMNTQLEQATQMKLRFFTNISHEFRTPLTLIIGPLQKIVEDKKFSIQDRKRFAMMHRNAIRLLRLINQLMDLRKIESGKLQLQAGYYDISSFLTEIKSNFDELAEQKEIEFSISGADNPIMLYFDREKLDKIIFNILSNAFKNTPDQGRIRLTITERSFNFGDTTMEGVEIELLDTGKGMSKEHIHNIFQRFYQIEQQRQDTNFPGTGIGLSLTKGLVTLHKGKIEIDSEKGKGTAVKVYLRKGKDHFDEHEVVSQPVAKPTESHALIQDEMLTSPDENLENDKEKKLWVSEQDKPLVIIVEDNADVRQYIADSLGNEYRIEEASNGEEGLEKSQTLNPDLVISDIMMPQMDGKEMTRRIKADLNTCHIPVILLTALASMDKKLEGIDQGADSYISKPFNSKHLQIRTRKLIENRRKIRKHYQENVDMNPDQLQGMNGMDKQFLTKTKTLIKAHMNEESLSVEMLGNELGMSRVHLYRKMKHLTGMTVSEFIREMRLNKALELLRESNLSIAEVSYKTGFSNPSYFTKCFKDRFKQPPSQFISA